MNAYQSKRDQMKAKLAEGLQTLSAASEGDGVLLGAALIKIHGALEDFIRIEVAEKAPHLREIVEDPRQTNWKNLLEYGRTYLGFTGKDCDIISEANYQRQNVAHGGNYQRSRADLNEYAQFVKGWCDRNNELANPTRKQNRAVDPQKTYQPNHKPAKPQPPPPKRETASYRTYRKPWYRSTLFLIFTFLFLTPLWAILILTDRSKGCFIKLFAITLAAFQILCISTVILLPLFAYLDPVQDFFRPLDLSPAATIVPSTRATPTFVSVPPEPFQTEIPAGTTVTCAIIWVEHSGDDLGGKNRSMVWEEFVEAQVAGTGMTARQFFDQVIEHNPVLATDGYVFEQGKTYLLPQCK